MKRFFEEACRKENLTEEHTKRIRQVYNTDYKKLQREKKYREEHGIVFNSLSAMVSDEEGLAEYDIPDTSQDPLEVLIFSEDEAEQGRKREVLQESLKEMEPDEVEILLTYYGGEYGIESQMARELGMDRKKFIRLRKKLLKKLQDIFFGKWEE